MFYEHLKPKSKINRKCYRKCDFQAFDWLKFTLTTDLRLTTFCEIDQSNENAYHYATDAVESRYVKIGLLEISVKSKLF
jgi:hypothetical protein